MIRTVRCGDCGAEFTVSVPDHIPVVNTHLCARCGRERDGCIRRTQMNVRRHRAHRKRQEYYRTLMERLGRAEVKLELIGSAMA